MAVQQYQYITPGNYTYDSGKIEVIGGLAKLKDDLTNVYARWHLNETTGTTVVDDSGNNRNGTTVNHVDADWVVGKLNNGLQFNTVNDEYIDCGAIADFGFDDTFSFEIWVKADNLGRTRYLFGKGNGSNGIGIYIEADGDVRAELESNNSARSIHRTVDVNIEDNIYHHVVVTYNGSRLLSGLTIYVDNIIPTTLNSNDDLQVTDILTTTENLTIGATNNGALNTFREGILDEAVIYNKELSALEVNFRYNTGSGRENWYYYSDKPTIESTDLFDPANIYTWDNFTEILGGTNQGIIGYNLYKVDKINKYYWNGSSWVTGGSSSNYNIVTTINTNIGTFDASPDKIGFIAYLISDNTQIVELDDNQITYTPNGLPLINIGSNKSVKDNMFLSPFSDTSFSDPDGNIIKTEYKIDGEIDVWTEISQGGFGTLLEAVQAFNYQFNNPGNINVQLQVTDDFSGGATSSDNLTVTVQQYDVIFNIKDTSGNHFANLSINFDDGQGWQIKNSPFTYNFDFNVAGYMISVDKPGFIAQNITVFSTDHTENITMQILGSVNPAVVAAAVWDELKTGHISSNSYGLIVQNIESDLIKVLGLSQSNYRILSPVYDTNNNLISGTIKIYPTNNDTDNDTNPIATYIIVATYDTNQNLSTYKITEN